MFKQRSTLRVLLWLTFGAMLLGLLSACTTARPVPDYIAKDRLERPELWAEMDRLSAIQRAQQKEVSYVSMSCVEHGVDIGEFHVEEVAHGQNISEQGGSFSCGGLVAGGYPVPNRWVPGLTIRVRWTTYDVRTDEFTWHEKYTTIAPYAEVGSLWVHFFPQNEVRVVVSNIAPSGPSHPIVFGTRVPPPEDPSHVPVPITGVNLDCVVHGEVSVEPGVKIRLDNPNFSNPTGDTATLNHRRLSVVYYNDSRGRNLIKRCRDPVGLQIDQVWQPGKKVEVLWRRVASPAEAAQQKGDGRWDIRRMLAVPRYDKPMKAWLHLFPNDEARLVFSDEPPDSPKHPIARNAIAPPPEQP